MERERRMLAADNVEGTAQERADLARQVQALVAMADAGLRCPLFSVVNKTEVPPSRNTHDVKASNDMCCVPVRV